jgi:hypothetical protein
VSLLTNGIFPTLGFFADFLCMSIISPTTVY